METLDISRPQHSWPKLSVWVDKLIMRIYCKFLLWLTTFQLVLWHKLSQHCWQSWPGNVCLWVPRNAPWWATCGKLHYSSLTRGRRPTITHVRHAQTHTHTLAHPPHQQLGFLVLPSTLSSLALPSSSSSSSRTLPTVLPSWQLQAPWKMSLARITIAQDRFH